MSRGLGKTHYDLLVIGSGPAGYRAAVQAAKLGKKVGVVEKTPGRLGGAWIHTGTIPSKTLRETMESIHNIRFHAGSHWVHRIIHDLPTAQLMGRAYSVSTYEEQIMRRYFDRYGVTILHGQGMFKSAKEVVVTNSYQECLEVEADYVLVATGSTPRRPADVRFDGWRIVDADELLRLESMPRSLMIYGAGVIGCEYACIFRAMGTDVVIVDARENIMHYMDREITRALRASMEASGIRFQLGSKMNFALPVGSGVEVSLEDGRVFQSDVLFYAQGRQGHTQSLGLEHVGLTATDRGELKVNEHFQTSVPNIYAAGDVIGPPALAATASAQGRYAALHMFGKKKHHYPNVFPVGIYTIPELSSVGFTEEELTEKGQPYVVGRAHYSEVARGYIRGDDHGLLKILVCKKTHKLLGIHILGHDACNLVHIGLAIMQKDGHAQDLVDMVFNYPTLAEGYRIAAFNALNKLFPDGEILDPPESI